MLAALFLLFLNCAFNGEAGVELVFLHHRRHRLLHHHLGQDAETDLVAARVVDLEMDSGSETDLVAARDVVLVAEQGAAQDADSVQAMEPAELVAVPVVVQAADLALATVPAELGVVPVLAQGAALAEVLDLDLALAVPVDVVPVVAQGAALAEVLDLDLALAVPVDAGLVVDLDLDLVADRVCDFRSTNHSKFLQASSGELHLFRSDLLLNRSNFPEHSESVLVGPVG